MHNQAQASTELGQLADLLTRQGYHATVITPAPYLALHLPGQTHPHIIYNSNGHYWRHTPQNIAPTSQTTHAAETITWALRTLHDTTIPPTSHHTGDQQC